MIGLLWNMIEVFFGQTMGKFVFIMENVLNLRPSVNLFQRLHIQRIDWSMKVENISAYKEFVAEVIEKIGNARYKAYKSLNQHQIALNFEVGRLIIENQEKLWKLFIFQF